MRQGHDPCPQRGDVGAANTVRLSHLREAQSQDIDVLPRLGGVRPQRNGRLMDVARRLIVVT
jgi:hypothetical protein